MTISLSCNSCGRDYNLKDDAAGKKFKCKDCGSAIVVPQAGEADDYGAGDDEFGDSSWQSSMSGSFGSLPPRSSGKAPEPKAPGKPARPRSSSGGSGNGELIGNIVKGLIGLIVAVGVGFGVMKAIQAGGGGGYNWREYNVPGTAFSLQLPGDPKRGSQPAGFTVMTTQTVELRGPERVFGIMYGALPVAPGDFFDINAGLDGAKQGMVSGVPGSSVISDRKLTITDAGGNVHPMIEIVARLPQRGQILRGYYRIAIIGNQMVIIMTGAIDSKADSYEADFRKCLDSFKITQAVPPIAQGNMNEFGAVPHEPAIDYEPIGYQAPPTIPAQNNSANEALQRAQERHEQMRRESEERLRNLRNR